MIDFTSKHLRAVTVLDNIKLDFRSFNKDVGVQTENTSVVASTPPHIAERAPRVDSSDLEEIPLSSADLTAILKWSKDISSDISLSSGKYLIQSMFISQ